MMLRFFLTAIMLLPVMVFCQLNDFFSDGNFSDSPKWQGDTAQFIVNPASQLQSMGPAISASIYLSTPSSQLINTSWQFWINLPFSSSSTNYVKIYLASDSANLKGALNGYYIKIGGESGNGDGIDLYRQNGTSSTKIIDGIAGHAGKSNNKLRIKILRDLTGNWKVYSDTTGGYNYSLEGQVLDSVFKKSSYAGMVYQYTSTRRNQFYFDDFIIQQAPLTAESVKILNDSSIIVKFNNPLDVTTLPNLQNFIIKDIENPIHLSIQNSNSIELYFSNTLHNGFYILEIKNLKDENGNLLSSQLVNFYFKSPIQYGDIILSELFPDPAPSYGLPGEEFIELSNTSENPVNLSGFQLSDPVTTTILPDFTINPNEYLILTTMDGKILYENIGNTIGLNPWPSLNNSGDNITLKDNEGNIVFSINYTTQWYHDSQKSDGGYTLEMINRSEWCKGINNWAASSSPTGGSPGKVNSINSTEADNESPKVLESTLEDSTVTYIKFDEELHASKFLNFQCDNNLLKSITAEKEIIKLQWEKSFPINSKSTITYHEIEDCLGNRTEGYIEIIHPGKPDSLDIIINELLFNPKPERTDFVEIYNRSTDIIDLQDLFLLSIKGSGQIISVPISKTHHYIYPNTYKVLCPSAEILLNNYSQVSQENIIEVQSFPSYNDDFGTVAIRSKQGVYLDLLTYSESFHSPFLKDKEGVSLERISFESPTNFSGNWHSSSTISGFATPGFENSMHYENTINETIDIQPKVITPNGDNQKDFAFINFRFNEVGNYCSIKIFNFSGVPVRDLANNAHIGENGFFIWDGLDDKGKVVQTGIYILLIEYFHPSGVQRKWKQSLVVYSD